MRKILWIMMLMASMIYAAEKSSIAPLNSIVKERMIQGGTWHQGCPVALEELRYLQIPYWGFDKQIHYGEMIVHKSVAAEVVRIFKQLYNEHYPIKQMRLMSDYNGDDDLSMQANNSSAFNCRLMTGSKSKWSKHSYGKAIDINPLQNPYVAKSRKIVLPKEGRKYIGRLRNHSKNSAANRAIILEDDSIVQIFAHYGWKWGGSWRNLKDYQHFEKSIWQEKKERLAPVVNKKKISPKNLFKKLQKEQSKELF